MRDAGVVVRMRRHAPDLDLLPVVGVRAAPRDAQLDGPAVHVRVAGGVGEFRIESSYSVTLAIIFNWYLANTILF